MKKIVFLFLAAALVLGLGSCSKKESNQVVIFSTSEDFRIENMQKLLNAQFPNYNIIINYYSTGNLAAKLKAEGTQTEADIIGELDAGYMEGILDSLADLSFIDSSIFLDDLVPAHHLHLPIYKNSGCIGINESFLTARNLPVPASYDDLLKPIYRGAISMPSPKASGTGYIFLKNLVNVRGEDAAFAYFDRFAENVLQFTSSGSGPGNALVQGEVGIGLGMTFQVVNQINQGVPLRVIFFAEGSPYNTYDAGIIRGRETREAVREVFEYYITVVNRSDKELFSPEQIFKDQANVIPNYPQNVRAADMQGIENLAEKERLLARWPY
jgi:iron(III) transport system substrate-binding protein